MFKAALTHNFLQVTTRKLSSGFACRLKRQGAFNCITDYATAKAMPALAGLEPATVGLTDHIKIAVCAFKLFCFQRSYGCPPGSRTRSVRFRSRGFRDRLCKPYTSGQFRPTFILNEFRYGAGGKLDAFLHYSRVCHSATPRDLCGTTGLEPVRTEAQLFPLALFIAVSIYWRSIRVLPSEFQIDSLV